jgi:hypothetical protein
MLLFSPPLRGEASEITPLQFPDARWLPGGLKACWTI